jgi:hypothetical protein
MMVSWIAIQAQPYPWVESRTDVAYVACGELPGQLSLIRPESGPVPPGIEHLLQSLERAISVERNSPETPSLGWLRKAMPDQGTSIRLSSIRRAEAASYEEEVRRLGSKPS